MYTIYINERMLRFISEHDSVNSSVARLVLSGNESKAQIQEIATTFETSPLTSELVLQSANIDKSWKIFCSNYKIIEAAGGVVVNPLGHILMILRNGKWDLPKGKIEAGEDHDTAAIREVTEECGIGMLLLKKQLSTTYHTYVLKGQKILKKTYWFLMKSDDPTTPIPQTDEGITKAVWHNRMELMNALQNAYQSIVFLLKEDVLDFQSGKME